MKQKIIIAVGPGQAAVLLPKYIVKPFLDDLCQPFPLLRRLIVKDLAAGNPFSVVVLGKFRRFLLVIFLSLFLHLDFSFIYSKFSMPFWGFFY